MRPDHLITTATIFALIWTVGAVLSMVLHRRQPLLRSILYATMGFVGLGAVVWADSVVSLGRNSAVHLLDELASRDLDHWCAAGLGICLGVVPALWPWRFGLTRRAQQRASLSWCVGTTGFAMTLVFLGLFTLKDELKPYLVHRDLTSIVTSPGEHSTPEGFVLDEYHQCSFFPVQIAMGPDECLYATGYQGAALQNGLVAKLQTDAAGRIDEIRVAPNLTRPHGLAFYDGDLYVSRSGQYAKAVSGTMTWINTGAVTRLRDLDGDGEMDFYEDVLSDLPGAQGPDPLHQNNGIAFSPDGLLYTTVGAHSDRAPAMGKYEGTILRSRADGSELTAFAEGFRNPFDVVVGPNGQLFSTDNDANDRRSGDELNHVVEGAHYGFPYADGSTQHPEGTVAPLMVTNGSLQGITYANSLRLPEELRDCLYAVGYENGEILRIRLSRTGDTYAAHSSLFARIPGAVDICVDQDGTFYVSCFHNQTIYRLRYREAHE